MSSIVEVVMEYTTSDASTALALDWYVEAARILYGDEWSDAENVDQRRLLLCALARAANECTEFTPAAAPKGPTHG